jgi:hypothetical protein
MCAGSRRIAKEAARDLVSFAIDGGTLIYGVAEDKVNRTFSLAPQPLNGLAEKIENIAPSSLVDPPLRIICEELPSGADPTRGYLVVHIPASPVAPPGGRTVLRTQRQDQVRSVRSRTPPAPQRPPACRPRRPGAPRCCRSLAVMVPGGHWARLTIRCGRPGRGRRAPPGLA